MATRSRYDAVAGTIASAVNLDKHAGGWVAYITAGGATGSITTSEVDVSGLSVTFTAEVDRVYRTTVMLEITSTVATDIYLVNVTDGSNVAQYRATATINTANQNQSVIIVFFQSAISGSTTRKVRASRAFGTGSLTAGAAGAPTLSYILIEDMGSV